MDTHFFNINIAKALGVDAAILLNNIHYWLEKNRANNNHFHKERYWTYNSVKAFSELFPYWTDKQIRRILQNLIDKKILLTDNFNKNVYDKTLWYSIDYNILCNICTPLSIFPKGQIDIPEKEDRSSQTGKPIPDINTDIDTDRIQKERKEEVDLTDVIKDGMISGVTPVRGTVKTNPPAPLSDSPQMYKKFDDIIKEFTNNDKLQKDIREYITYFGRSHFKLSNIQFERNLSELKKVSGGDEQKMIRIVDQTIKNGWKTFYSLKDTKEKRSGSFFTKADEQSYDDYEKGRNNLDLALDENGDPITF